VVRGDRSFVGVMRRSLVWGMKGRGDRSFVGDMAIAGCS